MASKSGPIAIPESVKGIDAFLDAVDAHPYAKRINRELNKLYNEVLKFGGTDLTQWSRKKYTQNDRDAEMRRAEHERIVRSFVTIPNPREKMGRPIIVVLMGSSGSGKTSVGVPLVTRKFPSRHFIEVNADSVKSLLPDYRGWNAGPLHSESKYVAERLIASQATSAGLDILYDVTGKDVENIRLGLLAFREFGYKIYLVLMDVPPSVAAVRAWTRFFNEPFNLNSGGSTGRFVYPRWVYKVAGEPRKTFDVLKFLKVDNSRVCDGFCRVDALSKDKYDPVFLEKEKW